jgi:hypothetical protein
MTEMIEAIASSGAQDSAPPRRLKVALVRAPIVSAKGALNNEATPSIAYAYLSAAVRRQNHECVVIDGIAEGLNRVWPLDS